MLYWVIFDVSSERRPLQQFPRKPTFACAAISVATGQSFEIAPLFTGSGSAIALMSPLRSGTKKAAKSRWPVLPHPPADSAPEIHTSTSPAHPGRIHPYSHAVVANGFVFVSGQITREDLEEQPHRNRRRHNAGAEHVRRCATSRLSSKPPEAPARPCGERSRCCSRGPTSTEEMNQGDT